MKSRTSMILLGIAAAICLIVVPLALCGTGPELCQHVADMPLELIGLLSIGIIGASYSVGDYQLRVTRALPNGAANVTSTAIDLAHVSPGLNLADHEFLIEAPVVNTTQLPDAQTLTYAVVTSANSDLSSPTVVNSSVLVQTGAGGAGAAATSVRFRLKSDCQRYVGVKVTKSGAGDATGATAVMSLKF